jgi:dipeptidyl aminopeptidase/acylaminoacyl peptidase
MKRFLTATSIVSVILAFSADVTAQVETEVALRTAIERETVKGDLKGAIDQYKQLARGKDRAVAARALVRLGQCYEKLGDAEAAKAYQRVVSEFADQTEAAAQARNFLAAKSPKSENGVVARLIANMNVPQGESYMGPLSNDGRYIAFTRQNNTKLPQQTNHGVFVHDLVTGERRLSVAREKCCLFNARISPDGKRVAYEVWPNTPGVPGLVEIHVSGVDGSNPRHLAGDKDVRAVLSAWSVDGTQLLASRSQKLDDPATERILITIADGSQRVIGTGRMLEARFSPDGKYIAFTKRRGERPGSDIAVVSVDGGTDVIFAEHAGNATTPVWTRDGKKLLFLSDRRSGSTGAWRQGTFDMWSIRVEQGKPAGPPEFVKERVDRSIDVTADGDCYYRTGTFSQNPPIQIDQLWVLKNLLGEKKAAR